MFHEFLHLVTPHTTNTTWTTHPSIKSYYLIDIIVVKEVSDFVVDHVEEKKQNGHGSVLAKNDNCSYNKTLKSDRSSNGGAKKRKVYNKCAFFDGAGVHQWWLITDSGWGFLQ